MIILRIPILCLILSGLLLSGCAGRVSGRFDMEQRFGGSARINAPKT